MALRIRSAGRDSKPPSVVALGEVWRVPVYWPGGVRHEGGASPVQAPVWNAGTPRPDAAGWVLDWLARGRSPSSGNCKGQSTDAGQAGGPSRSSDDTR